MVTQPTLEEIRAYIKVSADLLDDETLQMFMDAEYANQAATCALAVEYTSELRSAAFRRVARAVAAKGVPLGLLETDLGTVGLRYLDSEIRRLEQFFQVMVVA